MDVLCGNSSLVLSQIINPIITVSFFNSSGGAPSWWSLALLVQLLLAWAAFETTQHFLAVPQRRSSTAVGKSWRLARYSNDALLFRELHFVKPWLYPVWVMGTLLAFGLFDEPEVAVNFALIVHLLYFAFRTGHQAAQSVSSEKERGTLESLLATRLTPVEIFRSKYLAVVTPLLFEMVAFSPLTLYLATNTNGGGLVQGLSLLFLTLATILGISAVGVYASVLTLSSSQADNWVSIFIGVTFLGTIMLDFLLMLMNFEGQHFFWSAASPLMALIAIFWEPDQAHLAIFCSLLFLVIPVGLLKSAARRFARLSE